MCIRDSRRAVAQRNPNKKENGSYSKENVVVAKQEEFEENEPKQNGTFSSFNLNLNKKSAFNNIHHAENLKFKVNETDNGPVINNIPNQKHHHSSNEHS